MIIETIACAAIKYGNDVFVVQRPGRHDKVCQLMFRLGLPTDAMREQGFLTSLGRFVDRTEGAIIAEMANQLIRKTPPTDLLFSEDLW